LAKQFKAEKTMTLELLGAGAGALLAKEGYDRLGEIGERAYREMGQLGQDLESRYQFQPYSVFTPTGGMFYAGGAPAAQPGYRPVPGSGGFLPPPGQGMEFMPETAGVKPLPSAVGGIKGGVTPEMSTGFTTMPVDLSMPREMPPMPPMPTQGGQFGAQLSPEELGFYRTLMGGSAGMFGRAMEGPEAREQAVFDRMQAAMSPAQERERLALEQRLAAQGRLGVATNMFGGTPEGLALAKAQEEARNQAMLGAMEFAGAEQARQADIGMGMLGAAYTPQRELLAAIAPGITAAEQRRDQQNVAAGAYGETSAAALEALLQSAMAQGNLLGGIGGRMAESAFGGLFS
jgi:hypothetical protein